MSTFFWLISWIAFLGVIIGEDTLSVTSICFLVLTCGYFQYLGWASGYGGVDDFPKHFKRSLLYVIPLTIIIGSGGAYLVAAAFAGAIWFYILLITILAILVYGGFWKGK